MIRDTSMMSSKRRLSILGKGLSLWFACSSILLLTAASIMISYNIWLALLLGLVCVLNIGWGFIVKARRRRRQESTS
jgi:ABC-type bacteriocin/lantibiotic exporter with double-glycine peptidase domain